MRRIRGRRSIELDDLVWDPALEELRSVTERQVRRTLALASEFSESVWPADIGLSDEPDAALWQLAAIAPVTALDQIELLRSASAEQLLRRLGELTEDAALSFETPWPEDRVGVGCFRFGCGAWLSSPAPAG